MYYVGLMSGTSADAIDAVLLERRGNGWRVSAGYREPMPPDMRNAVHALGRSGADELQRAGELGIRLGRLFAKSALALLDRASLSPKQVRAIGSHGQTVRHAPHGSEPFTLQIGEPSIIAEDTGITTVAHFRARDMAAGGQGAPLVPAFHRAVFHSTAATRAVINIGGIANITYLPTGDDAPVIGFDTGPGNCLLDQWIEQQRDERFDRDGDWARSGSADAALLAALLSEEYFSRPAPKSTGRELFNLDWLARHLNRRPDISAAENVQATLLQLTVESIARALAQTPDVREVYFCGGGVHNRALLEELRARLQGIEVQTTQALGIDPDWVEAAAFAWLAHQALEGNPGNLPSVTGARHPAVLGGIYPA